MKGAARLGTDVVKKGLLGRIVRATNFDPASLHHKGRNIDRVAEGVFGELGADNIIAGPARVRRGDLQSCYASPSDAVAAGCTKSRSQPVRTSATSQLITVFALILMKSPSVGRPSEMRHQRTSPGTCVYT